jgi:2-oxoglutarate dehydrogenase E2 component (dihydrolipoamide succinyltransferase)
MAIEIKVPAVGESIVEGTLARWLKKEGDHVETDEPLFELETEKATTEVVAPASGTLKIKVPEGKTVPIGAVVGSVEEGGAVPAKKEARQPAAKVEAKPAEGRASARPAVPAAPTHDGVTPEVPLSPAVRRLVEESKVDVRQLAGTGPGGRITKEDVQRHVEKQGSKETPEKKEPTPQPRPEISAPPAAPSRGERRERMSAIRQRIADRLLAAQSNAAILTTFNEADMSAVMDLRGRYKDAFQKKYGVGLGFMSFFVKACVEALHAFPVVNARIEGEDVVYPGHCHVGVAVSTEKGLMVPVLRDAETLGFAAIERRIAELAQKARDGKIAVADLQGGTFTITNGGVFGSLLSTPILNSPQSAILGMHTIQKRPIAVGDQVAIRPMMYLALSYDHRLIDGREAVQFLVRVKECIENPERLLLEV